MPEEVGVLLGLVQGKRLRHFAQNDACALWSPGGEAALSVEGLPPSHCMDDLEHCGVAGGLAALQQPDAHRVAV
jgi:hypothetical protein